jgi:hypothetical protein
MCHIAIAPCTALSKKPMKVAQKPFEMIFLDAIPSPGILRCIPKYRHKQFLFLADPVSKYLEMLPLKDYSAAETIKQLESWQNKMVKKGFSTSFMIRADAGANFTSKEFSNWCEKERISLSLAGPKYQEQNAFTKRAYGTAGRMARSMLVRSHLPITLYQLALVYACKQLQVLPAKSLVNVNGQPMTTYAILHGKKPRIGRYKVFGCPVVFKRYSPQVNGETKTEFKELQHGQRGIFVGFPDNQAGWLIFVQEKILGSHLVVSMDVVFDQYFLSGITASIQGFAGSQMTRRVVTTPGRKPLITKSTSDITNLADVQVSHWGKQTVFDSDHECNHQPKLSISSANSNRYDILDQDDNSTSTSEDNDIDSSDDEPSQFQKGSINIDGLRRSTRVMNNDKWKMHHLQSQQTIQYIQSYLQ